METEMEHSGPMPMARRSADHSMFKQLFRFDPTISMGTLIQLGAIGVAVAVAFGQYREDKAKTDAKIEQIQELAKRDREEFKATLDRVAGEVRDMKVDVKDVGFKLAEIKGQISTKK